MPYIVHEVMISTMSAITFSIWLLTSIPKAAMSSVPPRLRIPPTTRRELFKASSPQESCPSPERVAKSAYARTIPWALLSPWKLWPLPYCGTESFSPSSSSRWASVNCPFMSPLSTSISADICQNADAIIASRRETMSSKLKNASTALLISTYTGKLNSSSVCPMCSRSKFISLLSFLGSTWDFCPVWVIKASLWYR